MNQSDFLKRKAKELRNDSTLGEVLLWSNVLRAKNMKGYQFNRQFIIAPYIVDFICRKLKLIIEVDGYSHQFKIEADKERDQALQELGYSVLRIQESDVRKDINNVIQELEHIIEKLKQK